MRFILIGLLLTSTCFGFEVEIISETENELILEIDLGDPDPQPRDIEGMTLNLPWWGEAEFNLDDQTGRLEPFFVIPVIVQPNGNLPELTLLEQRRAGDDLPPLPAIPLDLRERISVDADLPGSSIIALRKTGQMRSYHLAELFIMPGRQPDNYPEFLRIRLSFPGIVSSVDRTSSDHQFPVPGINKLQARYWTESRQRLLARSSSYEQGTWYKIRVSEHTVFRINAASFPGGLPSSDPRFWKVYAPVHEGRSLPLDIDLTAPTPEGLKEISTKGDGLGDGSFDIGDEMIFFARGARGHFHDSHYINPYTVESVYWLLVPDANDNEGLQVSEINSTGVSADTSISYYSAAFYHQNDLINILHTGPLWLGEQFNGPSDDMNLFFNCDYLANQGTVTLTGSFLGNLEQGSIQHTIDIGLNNVDLNVTQTDSQGRPYNGNGRHINILAITSPGILDDGGNLLTVNYTGSDANTTLYLDSLVLRYPRQFAPHEELVHATMELEHSTHQIVFEDLEDTYHFWDITDPAEIQEWNISGGTFNTQRNGTRHLLGFDDDQILDVILETAHDMGDPMLRRSDLQADYIIVAPERFLDQAERLKEIRSELIREEDRLSVIIAPLQTVYDEFSGGMADPAAIKYLLHHAYYNWQGPQLRYVLFLGDTDYDYRNITGQSSNMLPIWQKAGYSDISSYATDDWYVYLSGNDTYPDLAIGRLPAASESELVTMVDKIEDYLLEPEPGVWRNTVTLVGDDPWRPHNNEPEHIQQCEGFVNVLPKSLLFNKIYLTEYAEVQDPNSPYVKKPGAKDDLLRKIYNGTLLIHFMGHGSPRVWAQEEVFVHTDLPRVNTGAKLPFWIAATCDWAKFDDVSARCTPEELLLMQDNGAVGVISATRKSFSITNYNLFLRFYENLFPYADKSTTIPVGDALMIAKTLNYTVTSNDEKYVILCDPALKLATPRRGGTITSINPPVLSALGNVDYAGASDTLLGTDARAVVTGYDTPTNVSVEYAWPSGGDPRLLYYRLPGRRIFRGQISVEAQSYAGRFTVPRDIRYDGIGGIVNVQYWDGTGIDGVAYVDTLVFSGSDSSISDTEGPEILFTMFNTPLLNGDQISANEELVIELNDPQGINLTGQSGHGISLAIDGDWSNALDITELFEYDLDRSDQGRLATILTQISPGEHDISVRAWDNYNNPNTAEIRLDFFAVGDFKVFYVYNYPNPMQSETDFTFMLSHWAEVSIDIHTLSGRKIRTLESGLLDQGFNAVHWDGRDNFGNELANGVYIYIIHAENNTIDREETVLEKLVLAR